MQPFLFQTAQPDRQPFRPVQAVLAWLRYELYTQKLNSPLGYVLLTLMAFGVARIIGVGGTAGATWLIGSLVLIPALLVSVFHVRFGLLLLTGASFFILGLKRWLPGDPPVTLFIDAGVAALLFGVFLRQISRRDWQFLAAPLTFVMVLWLVYNVLELLNPVAPTQLSWIFAVRGQAWIFLLYAVGLYVFDDLKYLRRLAFMWVAIVTLSAVYGLVQEFFGLRGFEWKWALANADNYSLIEGGRRTFSFFSDPAIFGNLLSVTSLFTLVFITLSRMPLMRKALLAGALLLMLAAMLTTGTRTAWLILPAGYGLVMLLTLNLRIWLTGLLGVGLGALIWFMAPATPQVQRIKESFVPERTASFRLRMNEENDAQPFIYRYPMGSGVGTTGGWGQRITPDEPLAQLPAKGGYLRMAVETGWIGLILYLALICTALITSIRGYFRAEHYQLRTWYAAFAGVIFALALAEYTHQTLTQMPLNLLFCLSLAAVVRLRGVTPAA
ncbi:MAG: O-antigen ligase family protein [Bacteroidia bacterium]|nr:O-antigen ligase family protein [Bacteroidia bacterium]